MFDSRTADKFVVRFPEGMRALITELATAQHVSMNTKILAYIEKGIAQETLDNIQTWTPCEGMLVDAEFSSGEVCKAVLGKIKTGHFQDEAKAVVQRLRDGYCDDVPLRKIKPARLSL
jgi:hypothetical protein